MKTLNRFITLYQKINATTSRLEKEAILGSYRDDSEVRRVLWFLFNPYIVTGISEKKLRKETKVDCCDGGAEFNLLAFLDYFREHNTGRDEDLVYLRKQIANLENEAREIVEKLVTKDLKLGANEKTLNKVYGAGFIPTFSVMLAEKFAENPDFVTGKKFIITEKLDGVRCMLIFNEAGLPTFFSRAGQSFDDLTELQVEAQQLDKNYVYDGELLLGVDKSIDSADLYRLTVKVTAKDGEKTGLIYNVFDCLPKKDLTAGRCETPCETRKKDLAKQLEKLKLPHIKNVEILYLGEDVAQIDTICDEYTLKGSEGVMVNIADAPYECKRTKNLLKVKRFNSADVRVLSWEEGSGANKGKLGAVIVEFLGPDGKTYTCKVGSGFEKEEREYFFAHPEEIQNKIIEIAYFELSKNQNDDGFSLRFPTFKCVRHDKDEISMH